MSRKIFLLVVESLQLSIQYSLSIAFHIYIFVQCALDRLGVLGVDKTSIIQAREIWIFLWRNMVEILDCSKQNFIFLSISSKYYENNHLWPSHFLNTHNHLLLLILILQIKTTLTTDNIGYFWLIIHFIVYEYISIALLRRHFGFYLHVFLKLCNFFDRVKTTPLIW